MQLYFIRHAQSENNAHWGDENYQESSDPELTEIAKQQVKFLARFLGENLKIHGSPDWDPQNRLGFGISHLYTSLMVRAIETALPVANAIGLPLESWPEIHETGGIFSRFSEDEMMGLPGNSRTFFESKYPELILPEWLDEKGWWQSRPFEAYELRQPRAEKVWREVLSRHANETGRSEHRVAFVSHGGFFMHLLTTALGVDMRRSQEFEHEYWFQMNNCGITRIDVNDNRVTIMYVNRTDFLPDHLIT